MKFIKNIFIILGLIALGLLFISYDEGILVPNSFFIYNWQNILSLALCLFMLLSIIHPKGFFSKEIERKKLNPLFAGFGFVLVTFAFSNLLFEKSLPLHLHKISKKEIVTIEGTIDKVSIVSSKGELFKYKCKYKTIQVKGFKGEICGVPRHIIDNLYEGDKLILIGGKSSFGFIPFSVKSSNNTP